MVTQDSAATPAEHEQLALEVVEEAENADRGRGDHEHLLPERVCARGEPAEREAPHDDPDGVPLGRAQPPRRPTRTGPRALPPATPAANTYGARRSSRSTAGIAISATTPREVHTIASRNQNCHWTVQSSLPTSPLRKSAVGGVVDTRSPVPTAPIHSALGTATCAIAVRPLRTPRAPRARRRAGTGRSCSRPRPAAGGRRRRAVSRLAWVPTISDDGERAEQHRRCRRRRRAGGARDRRRGRRSVRVCQSAGRSPSRRPSRVASST